MHNNVLNYLRSIVKARPDKLAFSDGENGLTFAEVNGLSRSVGTFLAREGASGFLQMNQFFTSGQSIGGPALPMNIQD